MSDRPRLQRQLENLVRESCELTPRHIQRLSRAPTPLEFMRLVAANRPVIVESGPGDPFYAVSHWAALTRWSNEYLREVMGDSMITVAATPNGYADAVVNGEYFVLPAEKKMRFSQFIDILETSADPEIEKEMGVHYIQSQNGNMKTEFRALGNDVDEDCSFATEALERKPDAVNFWMGDDRSVTSLHMDYYENLYVTIAGQKIFNLVSPSQYYCLHESTYKLATYHLEPDNATFTVRENVPTRHVPWIPVDPEQPDLSRYPRFQQCEVLRVELNAGEMLYLPAMWFHQVLQRADVEGRCIAVNYWYDMDYTSFMFAQYDFMTKVVKIADGVEEEKQETCIDEGDSICATKSLNS